MKKTLLYILLITFITSCNNNKKVIPQNQKKDTVIIADTISKKIPLEKIDTSDIEKIFIKTGLINVQSLDSNIKVDLRYASNRNFIGFNMYGNIKNAYLQPNVAKKLVEAHKYLHDTFPNYNFLIF